MGLILGGMIIQAYLSTVLELEQRSTGTVLGTAIGTSASVPANPDNTLAQQLSDKEIRLDQREADLAFQELTIANEIQKERNRMLVYLLIGALIVLGLVAFNFYLDWFIYGFNLFCSTQYCCGDTNFMIYKHVIAVSFEKIMRKYIYRNIKAMKANSGSIVCSGWNFYSVIFALMNNCFFNSVNCF